MWSSTRKFRATQKTIWSEGSIYILIFVQSAKKLNMKSQERKIVVFDKLLWKRSKMCFLGSCDFNFYLFCNFLKNAPDYIDPSGHFVLYEHFCSSNFYNSFCLFFSKVEKFNITTIHNFFSESSFGIYIHYTSCVKKKFNSNHKENLENIV